MLLSLLYLQQSKACDLSRDLTDGEVGETMFHLDWQHIHIDSMAPHYSEVVPLESDYRLYNYQVHILYPEWQAMTREETKQMERWASLVSDELSVRTFVGVTRGKGLLDVDFIPVIRRDGKYLKLLSAKMEIRAIEKASRAKSREAAPVERYTRTSRLSEGRWVKISIKEDGMYKLTRSALLKMGFTKPQNVHLYGHGGYRLSQVSQPAEEFDDLQEVPLYQSDSDTWLFWGNGLVYWDGDERVFNPYATSACYFLTEEETPSEIKTVNASENISSANAAKVFTDHVLYEKDEYAWAQLGRNLYEGANFAQGNVRNYKLTATADSTYLERLTVAFTASSKVPTTLQPSVNGTNLTTTMTLPSIGSYQAATSQTSTFDVASLKQGRDWNIRLTSQAGHDAHLDYLALHFKRTINPNGSYVVFNAKDALSTVSSSAKKGPVTFEVSGFVDGYQVMHIATPSLGAYLVEGRREGDKFCFSMANGNALVSEKNPLDATRFVCFNPAYDYPQPTLVGVVENQNLHALDSLDMVILVPESGKLTAEAQRLADAHAKHDGLRCAVVRADQVYNEFSSGTPDATAYRRLMKMLYDRASARAEGERSLPRYLLLMGDCAFDNRMLTTAWMRRNPKDYLLCFESENSFSDTESYVMEDYFGLLDDGEGLNLTREKPDLGIGRFPVTTSDEARVMVDKVIDFISNGNAGGWKNVVSFLGDDGDRNSHMKYADDVAELVIREYPDLEVKKVMWDAYTRISTLSTNTYPEVNALIHKQLDDGVMLVNYTGHGAAYVLSHEAAWHISDFTSFHGQRLPVWYTAACDISPFDGQTENLGEQAVLTEGGGALAFIGTARTVYATNNWQLNRQFCTHVFGQDASGRRNSIGEALRLSKCSIVDSEYSYYENKLQYALLGDPALVIGAPLNRVQMTALKNTATKQETDVLKAGMPVCIEGEVQDDNGQLLSNFTGTVSVRVYDSMDTITCRRNDPSIEDTFVFSDRSSVLYVGQDSVRNGRFSISFVVPKDIKYSGAQGRMVFYAINQALDTEANGHSEAFSVGGSFDANDTTGPEIEMTLNGEPGGTVNMTPYLVARLADESGINVTGNGVGHDILLSIDDDPARTYVLNDYYVADFGDFTHGSLSFTIPALPEGRHTLKLRAWDMLNNTSLAQMDFDVDKAYEPTLLHLGASPNPALTHTTFLFSCDLPGTECHYLLEVFDFAGRRLWYHEGNGSSSTGHYSVPWNLRVGAGYGRISPGIYLYRLSLTAGESRMVTQTQKLIVH